MKTRNRTGSVLPNVMDRPDADERTDIILNQQKTPPRLNNDVCRRSLTKTRMLKNAPDRTSTMYTYLSYISIIYKESTSSTSNKSRRRETDGGRAVRIFVGSEE